MVAVLFAVDGKAKVSRSERIVWKFSTRFLPFLRQIWLSTSEEIIYIAVLVFVDLAQPGCTVVTVRHQSQGNLLLLQLHLYDRSSNR